MQVAAYSPAVLRSIQERAARAQPVEHVAYTDGWWLRRTASSSWWLGSVLPHGEPAGLLAQVEHVERWYAAHGLDASFQINPGACPDDLGALLAARGYAAVSRTSLQTAATAAVLSALPASALQSRVDDHLTDEWFDVWLRVHDDHDHRDTDLDRANLERLALPSAYASIALDGKVIAVGRAVAETGWTGLFGLGTLSEARGRGAGRELLRVLSAWAGEQGAPGLYLQVQESNRPANTLYAKAGFTEALSYHYRSRA